MDTRHRYLFAIAAGALAALLAVHIGDAARLPIVGLVAALALWALREPAVGLLAALPLVYMIHPTPTTLGWRELGFVAVLGAGGLIALWRERGPLMALLFDMRWVVVAAIGWFALNLATALAHGVSLPDWVRGVGPFAFLLYLLPVWLEARQHSAFASAWRIAVGVTAALFAWHVVYVYTGEQLWKPATYIFEQGQWIPMSTEQGEALGKRVFAFAIRVTQRVQQSTDVLLPLGVVWGVWGTLWARRASACILGLGLATLATVGIVLTYTRSMLLVAALVAAGLLLGALRRGLWLRSAAIVGVLSAAVAATIVGFDLGPIYLNRLHQMKEQTSVTLQEMQQQGLAATINGAQLAEAAVPEGRGAAVPEGRGAAVPEGGVAKDANITARLDEYRIAWDMFAASPLLGQGLGVRHAIRFDTGLGEVIEQRVGYVHNWVVYTLMVGGGLGFAAYATVLLGPAARAVRGVPAERGLRELVFATVAGMAVYGLFFAVFRLIPFNLVLGGLWGLILAAGRPADVRA